MTAISFADINRASNNRDTIFKLANQKEARASCSNGNGTERIKDGEPKQILFAKFSSLQSLH